MGGSSRIIVIILKPFRKSILPRHQVSIGTKTRCIGGTPCTSRQGMKMRRMIIRIIVVWLWWLLLPGCHARFTRRETIDATRITIVTIRVRRTKFVRAPRSIACCIGIVNDNIINIIITTIVVVVVIAFVTNAIQRQGTLIALYPIRTGILGCIVVVRVVVGVMNDDIGTIPIAIKNVVILLMLFSSAVVVVVATFYRNGQGSHSKQQS